jgi:hypothetical protein
LFHLIIPVAFITRSFIGLLIHYVLCTIAKINSELKTENTKKGSQRKIIYIQINNFFPIPADAEAALPEPGYSDPALWSPGTRTGGRPLYLAPAASYHCATLAYFVTEKSRENQLLKKEWLGN